MKHRIKLIYSLFIVSLACFLIFNGCTETTSSPISPDSSKIASTIETPEAAKFSVSDLVISPQQVKIRDRVTITVLVTNSGEETGTFEAILKINGEYTESKEVTLVGETSKTVSFSVSREIPGNYSVEIGGTTGSYTIEPPPEPPSGKEPTLLPPDTKPTRIEHSDWIIPAGTGTIYRAVNMGGNWGTNKKAVKYLPEEYFIYLKDLNVNWVGISVALHIDGSMDSTVELNHDERLLIPTFPDGALRKLISTFRSHGFNVAVHMAFESGGKGQEHPVQRWQLGDPMMHNEDPEILPEYWPWRTDHPQHESFVSEFWQTYTDSVVHIAKIAEEEGVGILTLGTETDRLFRSRSGGGWPNHFLEEMRTLVSSVRNVFHGQVCYDMHYQSIVDRSYLGPGSDYLVKDLGLDFIAVSAYFSLMKTIPDTVPTVQDLEASWDSVFNDHIKPLKERNENKPVIFTEFGYVDSTGSLKSASADEFTNKTFKDKDGNGKDDGEETQANAYQALFNTIENDPGIVNGAFLWGVSMATEQEYQNSYAKMRTFNIRGKLAEDLVREQYGAWR
ncbi:hypothetical protein ACFLUG_02730 [Chloroflexota bacterium]